jgi:hypothetical protein
MIVELKPRFKDHGTLNNVVHDDWIVAIENSLDAFQALLYFPIETAGDVIDTEFEQPLFNQVDENQTNHTYSDPIVVSVTDNPDDTRPMVTESGSESVTDYQEPMVLRIGHHNVPVGAILEWEEVTTGDVTRRCWWYVHSSVSIGTTLSAAIHNVIPCRDFEGLPA